MVYNDNNILKNWYTLSNLTSSEPIRGVLPSKIAQKFTTDTGYDIKSVTIFQKSGGSLWGNVRIETDLGGSPRGSLVDPNAEKKNIELDGQTTFEFTTASTLESDTTYWIVFERTSGSGIFLGGTDGTSDRCKWWYRDSWKLSSNVENIYFITWDDEGEQEWYTTYTIDSETICGIQTIQDDEFAGSQNSSYLGHTPVYARRVLFMQQCYSGGFIDDLSNPTTVTATACNASEGAWRADDSPGDENEDYDGKTYYHGEFNLHFMSAFYGETPAGDDVDADDNNDGYISVWEAYKWAEDHDSLGETPQYDDDGNGRSQQDDPPDDDNTNPYSGHKIFI